MNENSKTLTYVGIAAVLLGLGIWRSLPVNELDQREELGKEFFPTFNDARKVAGAEVIDFDASRNVKLDLKAVRVGDGWQINPERQAYPEVSPERLAEVVKTVSGLKKLTIVTDETAKHADFGVVDPGNESELKGGTQGVGKRVTLLDSQRKRLVDLIIGKHDEKHPDIFFVREPGRDRVYTAQLDIAPLSSRFADWVQGDLLGLGTADLRKVDINDYAIDQEAVRVQLPDGRIAPMLGREKIVERAKADLAKPANEWQLTKLETFDKPTMSYVEKKLAADEEVDSDKLAGLKGALAGLKIADARAKPKVLAADLKKEKTFLSDPQSAVLSDSESIYSLQDIGIIPSPNAQNTANLICEEGELKVGFGNGVQYHLRFGGLTTSDRSGKGQAGAKDGAKSGGDKPADGAKDVAAGGSTSPNRYMMVVASFNQDLIPKPELETLPPETTAPKADATTPKAEPAATPKPSATPSATGATPAAEPKATPAASPSASPIGSKPADGAASGSEGCETPGDACQPEPTKPEATKPEATKPAATKPAPSATASATKPEPAKPEPTPSASKPAPTASATASKPAATPSATPSAAAPSATKPATPAKTDAPPPADPSNPIEALKNTMKAILPPTDDKPAPKPISPEERTRITEKNKQATLDYEAKVKEGREKAKELNDRFADWYYVIDDATYRALDLDPTMLTKKKGASPPPGGNPHGGPMNPDFMRQFQQQLQQGGAR